MAKITKRVVDAAEIRSQDYFIWDDELPGFGVRVFPSAKRSYLVQYRAAGRTRRYTIGLHGVWAPEEARREGRILLGRIARGENPSEQRKLDLDAMTVRELCERYLGDAEKGLILGKGRRPKKQSTLAIDRGRIERHLLPLLGNRRVKDLSLSDVNGFVRDIASGKTQADIKTGYRGRAIVRGGIGTAARTVGLLGGILTYAVDHGVIERNPANGVRKAADQVRTRRLTEQEYRLLGTTLRQAGEESELGRAVSMIRLLAMTGCRRGEVIKLQWPEVDAQASCLRLNDSKEGSSVRPIGVPVLDFLDTLRPQDAKGYVFTGTVENQSFVGFPRHWKRLMKGSKLEDITPHVLRHSFASMANDLGFTEATVAALLGHSRGTVTSRYIHVIDTALVMAADTVSAYIQALLNDVAFTRGPNALDRDARRSALARFLGQATEQLPIDHGPPGP